MRFILVFLSVILLASASHAAFFGLFGSEPEHNALTEAAELGNKDYVKKLIKQGADINSVDANGNTALMNAAKSGNQDILNYLVEKGADLNMVDAHGRTALHYAAKNGFADITKTLVKAGADTTITDIYGMTALKEAMAVRNVSVIKAIDPTALVAIQSEAAFPVISGVAAAAGGGGISTTTLAVAGGAAAAAGGVAAAAGGGGGGGGGSSSSGGGGSGGGDSGSGGGGSGGGGSGGGDSSGGGSSPTPSCTSGFLSGNSESAARLLICPSTIYNSYSISNINAAAAYDAGYTGQGVTIAIVDTGVDLDHVELDANILTGYDFYNNDNNPDDDNGHGTHVAGIAAAEKNNIATHGVAYDAKILPIKALSSSGSGHSADIAKGIYYAINHGSSPVVNANPAKIINLSIGSSNISSDPLFPDIEAAMKSAIDSSSVGALIVAAAGNDSKSNVSWPARYAATITESGSEKDSINDLAGNKGALIAVVAHDSSNSIASFSNHCGDAKDWCLSAPGAVIVSSYKNNQVAVTSGTSMAAPQASGAAAIIFEASLEHNNTALTGRQVAQILLDGANSSFSGYDADIYGHGLLDVEASLNPLGVLSVPTGSSVGTGSVLLSTSSITTSSAFGDALSGSGASFTFLDGYNRAYNMKLASVTQGNDTFADFDRKFGDYGYGFISNDIQISDNISFAYSNIMVQDSQEPEEEADSFARMSFGFENEKASASFNYNVPMEVSFAPAVFDGSSYRNTIMGRNSFVSFVERGSSYVTKFKTSDKTTVRSGSFISDDNGGSVLGFISDFIYHADNADLGLQTGFINEENTLLGGRMDGAFAIAGNTPTWFYNFSGQMPLEEGIKLFGEYNFGITYAEAATTSILEGISDIKSTSFALGVSFTDRLYDGDSLTLKIAQPLRAESGSATFDLPVARDIAGNIYRSREAISLSPSGREIDLGVFYDTPYKGNSSLNLGAIYRMQPDHNKYAEPDSVFMVKYRLGF